MKTIIQKIAITLAVIVCLGLFVYGTNKVTGCFSQWVFVGDVELTKQEILEQIENTLKGQISELNTLEERINQINIPLSDEQFCVLRSGGKCPTNFNIGTICIDSEDSNNKDFQNGVVGASGKGNCGQSSMKFEFCCR